MDSSFCGDAQFNLLPNIQCISVYHFLRQARKKIDLSFTTKNMIWSAAADDGQFKKKLPYVMNKRNEIAVN